MVRLCGSECHGVVIINSWCQPHAPVPCVCEGQSHVHQSLCVVARSASLLVLGCSANLGYCTKGVGNEEWLWGWCCCTATISPMPGSMQHCVPCHTMHLSFFWATGMTFFFLSELFPTGSHSTSLCFIHLLHESFLPIVPSLFYNSIEVFLIHNQQLWASASEPTSSVPTTQSPERKVVHWGFLKMQQFTSWQFPTFEPHLFFQQHWTFTKSLRECVLRIRWWGSQCQHGLQQLLGVNISLMHLSLMCEEQLHVHFKPWVLLQGQQVCWCWASLVTWHEC